ncbi:MAG: putative molybdenum carrier protein, partial [Oscillospiraceae bacterium]
MKITQIISGGQTGVDRAALDFAIIAGIPHGGWCPLGRTAEDGIISDKYELTEMSHGSYRQRT